MYCVFDSTWLSTKKLTQQKKIDTKYLSHTQTKKLRS